MTVSVRTNRATNPRVGTNATNYTAISGTGGTASGARATGGLGGYDGSPGYYRVTWSVATTAVSGGARYTQTGLSANTQYSFAVWVRASKTQTVRLTAQYQNSSSVNVGTAFTSSNVALTATVWTPTPLVINGATSGAAVDRVLLSVEATTGGVNWANADTLDIGLVLIETGATAGEGFSGATANTTGLPSNLTYAWTGTADASTSTETLRTVTFTVEDNTQGTQSPRAIVTITDAGTTATYTVTVTRTCEGDTTDVQAATDFPLLDTEVVRDFAIPLQRLATYNLLWNGATVATASMTMSATTAWVQDPLRPDEAIPVKLDGNNPGYLTVTAESLQDVAYPVTGKTHTVLGSRFPVFMGGQPTVGSGVRMQVFSDDKATADDFRNLCLDAPVLLVRPLLGMDPLPAVAYMTRPLQEKDVNRKFTGTIAEWTWTGDLVEAVYQAVVSGLVTYADVQALIGTGNTYAQVQTKSAAKTYLDWQKNPLIWSTL